MKLCTLKLLSCAILIAAVSCTDDLVPDNYNKPGTNHNSGNNSGNNSGTNTGDNTGDNTGTDTPANPVIDYTKYALGDLAAQQGIKLGAAFTYWEYRNNSKVAEILTREFKAVTFGNEMKHDAIVQQDGRMVFTTADQMAQWTKDAGAELFGHVLGWHSQQQTKYLNALISQASAGENPINPQAIDGGIDFESFSAGSSAQLLESGLFTQINGSSYVSVTSDQAHSGSLSLKMDNSGGQATNSWDIQVITKAFPVTAGKTYRIAWYGKASKEANFQIDLRGDGDTQYKSTEWGHFSKPGTSWTYQYLDYTVQSGTELSIAFYGASEAVIYYIDDIQVFPADAAPASGVSAAVAEAIDNAFKTYVYGMVEHFDVYAWDVVNETFSDGTNGAFRTQQNTQNGFVWGTYYPSTKDWVDAAFTYATDACAKYGKKPVLYINDYNLETDPGKRRALCNYAKNNPKVTGVASQMHLDMSTPDLKGKIEASLKDLAATGKMVRIAELDLKNKNEKDQADIFVYIFQKYLEIVPPAQRGGITFWGINDKDSWVGEENHPLLWKNNIYQPKESYYALWMYLCELNGLSPYKE